MYPISANFIDIFQLEKCIDCRIGCNFTLISINTNINHKNLSKLIAGFAPGLHGMQGYNML